MHEEYGEQLQSNFADFANAGTRDGGASVAANFLSRVRRRAAVGASRHRGHRLARERATKARPAGRCRCSSTSCSRTLRSSDAVDFYMLESDSEDARLRLACRIADKATQQDQHVFMQLYVG